MGFYRQLCLINFFCTAYNKCFMLKTNRNLFIIALIAFVNMLGYGIIIPILYSFSKKFGLSDFENGLLFAIFSLCQFISTPVIGRLSDKFGRRPMLLISIIGTAVSFFTMAFARNYLFLFIARAIDGLTAGNIPVAFAVISDSTKQEERPKAFGLISAAFNFGFVFGPAISALTFGINSAIPFLIAGSITVIAVILTALYLPETNKHMGEVKEGKLFDFPKLWHTLFDPNVGATFLISLIYFLGFACAVIYGFQPYVINVLKLNATSNAYLFTLFGIVGLITQTFLVQFSTKKWGLKNAFRYSILVTGFSFLIISLMHSVTFFVIAMILLAIFNGIGQTLIPTILSGEADDKSQGSIMGLNASYQSIGMIIGPLIGGAIASYSILLDFLLGSVLMFVCFGLTFEVLRPGIKKESAF
jgi:MFS family permease